MAWNRSDTILQSGATAETDADVIFTAAFVGLAIGYAKQKQNWRVAMEPEMEIAGNKPDQRDDRTKKDKETMSRHNQLCTLVNHVVRRYTGDNTFRLSWGFTPSFTAGGMIAGGDRASQMDTTLDPSFKAIARKYLTAASTPSLRTDPWEMYIGRGAYCGLVVDDQGNAVSAMSSVRTTLKEEKDLYPHPLNSQIGDRWCPPETLPAYANKDSAELAKTKSVNAKWIWGMIGTADDQGAAQSEGMKFYCGDDNRKGRDIVGYTHGLPRCVYECVRAKKGLPYEMSIGVRTFKLASCMGCTFFMIANGFAPSASHVGRAESWAPLYHVYGNNPSELLAPLDAEHDQIKAFELANNRWADKVTDWMKDGVEALAKVANDGWVTENHRASLAELQKRVNGINKNDPAQRFTCCNLLLDAFTWHKGDAVRVIQTLQIGANAAPDCDGKYWWWDTDTTTTLDNYKNPYSDDELRKLGDLSALKVSAAI
jgi:hypothetical protein